MENKGTYRRKYYLHRMLKRAGFSLQLEQKCKTITVDPEMAGEAKDNVWFGVTAENQEQANLRIPILLQIPAAKRFVSIEPMLGPVDLTGITHFNDHLGNTYLRDVLNEKSISGSDITNYPGRLDWVICGGESGPKARPMSPDWVRSLRDQGQSAEVPFFFKQWGEWLPIDHTDDDQFRKSKKSMEVGYSYTSNTMLNVGRKAAGNLLDGQQYHNWPKINL